MHYRQWFYHSLHTLNLEHPTPTRIAQRMPSWQSGSADHHDNNVANTISPIGFVDFYERKEGWYFSLFYAHLQLVPVAWNLFGSLSYGKEIPFFITLRLASSGAIFMEIFSIQYCLYNIYAQKRSLVPLFFTFYFNLIFSFDLTA